MFGLIDRQVIHNFCGYHICVNHPQNLIWAFMSAPDISDDMFLMALFESEKDFDLWFSISRIHILWWWQLHVKKWRTLHIFRCKQNTQESCIRNTQESYIFALMIFATLLVVSTRSCYVDVNFAYILAVPSWLAETRVDSSIQDTSKTWSVCPSNPSINSQVLLWHNMTQSASWIQRFDCIRTYSTMQQHLQSVQMLE